MSEELKPESTDRDRSVEQLIKQHVGFAMAAGAIPFPIVDIAAVFAVQLDMLKKVCREHNVEFAEERGKTLVTALITASAGSVLGRMGASALKVVPGIGMVLGVGSQVVVAGASTYAIGHVFHSHFKNDGTLFDVDVKAMGDSFVDWFKQGKEVAEHESTQSSKENVTETIARLHGLREGGAITDQEYEKAKAELLKRL